MTLPLTTKARANSIQGKQTISRGYCRTQFIDDLIGLSHHLKPSSRVYRLLRSEKFEYFSTFELMNTWTAMHNFKYND